MHRVQRRSDDEVRSVVGGRSVVGETFYAYCLFANRLCFLLVPHEVHFPSIEAKLRIKGCALPPEVFSWQLDKTQVHSLDSLAHKVFMARVSGRYCEVNRVLIRKAAIRNVAYA